MGVSKSRKNIGLETILQRHPNLLFNQVDGETVMLSMESSSYYGLDKTATRIWELLEKPIKLGELITNLVNEYDVSNEQCQIDTIDFVKKLINQSLVIAT